MSRRPTIRSSGLAGLVALVTALLVLSGCAGPTFSSLPLPGSGVSGKTITISADFGEALNLAQGASVRVNGVDSGRVTSVSVDNFRAKVNMTVRSAADLRDGATARLRYTTPLGELFVDVTNPSSGPLMVNGSRLTQTSTAPTVEDSLASASLLINGGGLAQLQTITTEANKALGGHEANLRDLINRSSYLLTQVNASSGDIDRALNALNGVSVMLHQRRAIIHQALVDVRPASRVLRANLGNITALLASLDRFAGTANGVVTATRTQVLTLLREAGPVLQELVNVRGVFPQTLQSLISLAAIVDKIAPGDYVNLGTHLRLDGLNLGGKSLGLGSLPSGSKAAKGSKKPTSGKGLGGLSGLAHNITQGVAGSLLDGLLGGLLGGGK